MTTIFNDFPALEGAAGSRLVFTQRGGRYFLKAVESPSACIHAHLTAFKLAKPASSERAAQESDTTFLVALK